MERTGRILSHVLLERGWRAMQLESRRLIRQTLAISSLYVLLRLWFTIINDA
jgi:hypothetical protein